MITISHNPKSMEIRPVIRIGEVANLPYRLAIYSDRHPTETAWISADEAYELGTKILNWAIKRGGTMNAGRVSGDI